MKNGRSALKRLGLLIFVSGILLTVIDYYGSQKRERRWNVEWRKSPESFQLLATKRKKSRKE